jgi:hypothetical protein
VDRARNFGLKSSTAITPWSSTTFFAHWRASWAFSWLGRAPVQILTRVLHGHPAHVLLDAASGAQLLVVGSRGHGAFAGMLLGSVSQHCVQHASCPVVVVPPADLTQDKERSRS